MKQKKNSNNSSAMLVVLGLIFVGAMVSIGRTLFSPVPAVQVQAANANAEDPKPASRASTDVLPASGRDPFSSPLLRATVPASAGSSIQAGAQVSGTAPDVLHQV